MSRRATRSPRCPRRPPPEARGRARQRAPRRACEASVVPPLLALVVGLVRRPALEAAVVYPRADPARAVALPGHDADSEPPLGQLLDGQPLDVASAQVHLALSVHESVGGHDAGVPRVMQAERELAPVHAALAPRQPERVGATR